MGSDQESVTAPLLTDRTTIETDWTCGMRRWWYKEEGGVGIVPVDTPAALRQGSEYHVDFADIAEADSPEKAAIQLIEGLESRIHSTTDGILQEELTRRAGWIAANALFLEPQTRQDYLTLGVEFELVLERGDLWIAATPDRVLERKTDGAVIYRDYKGVGGWGVTKRWLDQWPYAVQQHTVLKALEEELGRKVAFGQVIGLSKGQEKYGRLQHPYVWAYWSDKEGWIPAGEGGGKKDLTPRPVWEYDGGILEWVRKLGPEVAAGQFAFSPPIYLNERLLADLVTSRTRREKEVRIIRRRAQEDRTLRAKYFEPKHSACSPAIGSSCPYLLACHNETINRDPLGSGLFVRRTPHHELEIIGGQDDTNT